MNITFLLGNGFDIGLGLKTGYESFFQQYCIIHEDDTENIKAFKQLLSQRHFDEVKRIINWADFEKAFGQHSLEFSEETKDQYIERFEHFVVEFNKYIEAQEARVDYSDASGIGKTMLNAIKTFSSIRAADKDVIDQVFQRGSSGRVYSFISFNYTRTVDNCVGFLQNELRRENGRSIGKVLHIHGYVDQTMIMGVNDEQQIANRAFSEDEHIVREIVKPRQNSDARTNYERQVARVINDSNIICIYGMSLGETDRMWWQLIANWLAKHTSNTLVILSYNKDYDERFTFSQRRVVDALLERFLSFSELSTEIKERISKQIFVGVNHNIFQMNLCRD